MFIVKISTILLIVAGIFLLLLIGCCAMSARWSRKEEREDPCTSCALESSIACLRCPWRKE